MEQLICHLVGDYIFQSDWMANQKTKSSVAALCHVLTYSLPFLLLRPSWTALLVIGLTHFFIDHWRLARFVVYAKNYLAPVSQWPEWENCRTTGYPADRPAWLAVWLLIFADNTLHLAINCLALRYL